MSDEEKAEMRAADPRTRSILERVEAMDPGQFIRLHGVLRDGATTDQSRDAEDVR
jgi:hypothetical protein